MSLEPRILLTMLNGMAGGDVRAACKKFTEWNIRVLDLKDGIFGKSVESLSPDEARAMRELADGNSQEIHTLSTCLFVGDIEEGEAAFRSRYAQGLENVLAAAPILRPCMIRLLAACSSRRAEFSNSAEYVSQKHPWLFDVYREAIDRVHAAGFRAAIENETHRCLFSHPQEILDFFHALDRPLEAVCLTWDIQNLWQMGTYPTMDVYRALRPVIGMVHLKGGRAENPGGTLKWRSDLEDASWPVLDIVRAIATDGASPVICLNPSHGADSPAYRGDFKRDIDFLRREIRQIE